VSRNTLRTGRSKRYDDRNRFSPIGGVRYPSSMLARKIIPRWAGSMP
jgi:hypothetical protein